MEEYKMGKIIAIANQKGGKTTTAIMTIFYAWFMTRKSAILFVSCEQGKLCISRDSVKQIGKIVVNRNTQNTITKTHTHTPLKAVDFGFRTKKKGQAYNASIQSRKSQRLYNHAKPPLTQPPVIPVGKRIALSNALIAPGMEFYSARVSLYQQSVKYCHR